jgi:hypothetical protein
MCKIATPENADLCNITLIYIFIYLFLFIYIYFIHIQKSLGWRSGKGTALLAGRSRDRSPVVSLGIFFSVASDNFMCPGSTQPLKMSTRILLGVTTAGAYDSLSPSSADVIESASLNLPEPSGPHRPVMGLLYLLHVLKIIDMKFQGYNLKISIVVKC